MRSLVSLLDDEDPKSLALVRSRIMDAGTAALPFLEEARAKSAPPFAEKLEEVADDLRFAVLKREFLSLAVERAPDLEVGAMLLSRFGRPQDDPAVYRAWLDRVAGQIGETLREDAPPSEAVK